MGHGFGAIGVSKDAMGGYTAGDVRPVAQIERVLKVVGYVGLSRWTAVVGNGEAAGAGNGRYGELRGAGMKRIGTEGIFQQVAGWSLRRRVCVSNFIKPSLFPRHL